MSCKNFKKINSWFVCWKRSLPGSECTLLVVHTRRIPMCWRKEEILVFRNLSSPITWLWNLLVLKLEVRLLPVSLAWKWEGIWPSIWKENRFIKETIILWQKLTIIKFTTLSWFIWIRMIVAENFLRDLRMEQTGWPFFSMLSTLCRSCWNCYNQLLHHWYFEFYCNWVLL